MSTSATNSQTPHQKRWKKICVSYASISLFFFVFSRIYEHFSFGEVSFHMHWLFFIPLLGGSFLLILLKWIPHTSKLSINLWNSSVALASAGALLRGIINLSGRSTMLDLPYYYGAGLFLLLAFLAMTFTRSIWTD